MSRPLALLALVWATFLLIFAFAARGDTSALHITYHLFAVALLVVATVMAWRMRPKAPTAASRWTLTFLSVTVPVGVLGHVGELVVAIQRLARDGWVNRDTTDIWQHGPHVTIANVTIPALMLSMLLTAVLVGLSLRRRGSVTAEREASRVG